MARPFPKFRQVSFSCPLLLRVSFFEFVLTATDDHRGALFCCCSSSKLSPKLFLQNIRKKKSSKIEIFKITFVFGVNLPIRSMFSMFVQLISLLECTSAMNCSFNRHDFKFLTLNSSTRGFYFDFSIPDSRLKLSDCLKI